MKINGGQNPAAALGVGKSQNMVDQLIEAQSAPIKMAEARKEKLVEEKNEYNNLSTMLGDLRGSLGDLNSPSSFTKMKVESSNPDVLDAAIEGNVLPGSYEFEVNSLASKARFLDSGFADKDKTTVGFGFMGIENSDGTMTDIDINPGSTLQDVAAKINDVGGEFQAQIVNTGHEKDPFKLMVSSIKTGKAANIKIDEDTTFLDFKKIKPAKNFDVKFEDVAVTGAENKMNDLLEGLNIDLKKAAPGEKVSLNITKDLDKSVESVSGFVDKYNKILEFSQSQKSVPGQEGSGGALSRDSNLRMITRRLQSAVSRPISKGGKFSSLAQVGITTNAKSGSLEINKDKLKKAMNENYDDVMKLFANTESQDGLANVVENSVKSITDPTTGVIKNRTKSLDTQMKNQDKNIERQKARLEKNRTRMEKQFRAMESTMAKLENQGQFMSARMPTPPTKVG